MRLIDQHYLACPFYGSWCMTAHLRKLGFCVNRKRVRRLMARMGLKRRLPSAPDQPTPPPAPHLSLPAW